MNIKYFRQFVKMLKHAVISPTVQQMRLGDIEMNGLQHTRSAEKPAPIDCKLKSWSAWSPCSSCTEWLFRFQHLERPSQFGGEQCVHSQWDKRECKEEGDCQPQDHCGETFACGPNGRCIGQQLRCSGESECLSGEDEIDCNEINKRETKCIDMLAIPGAEKSTQGFNVLSGTSVNPVLDHNYYGGVCEYTYNGEWRKLAYDPFCEHLGYEDDEKYYRKPYNFLSYQLMAQATTEQSSDYYEDAASFLNAIKSESSFNFGVTVGVYNVEVGLEAGFDHSLIRNISQYSSKEVGFVRLLSKVQTAQFKMRSKDLMLDEEMLWALTDLPVQYDFAAYSHFFNVYGTHYITEGTMGGVLDYVAVVNKNAMTRKELYGESFGYCIGASLGLSVDEQIDVDLKLKAKHCDKDARIREPSESSSDVILDTFGFVKGGHTGPSTGNLHIRDEKSYKIWGRSLKYNPALIDFEVLPIYELVRFSTAVEQLRAKIPHLKRALEEYMQIFNTCRCAACLNNGEPVLSRTSCSCSCKSGYSGGACEETQRTGPTHGSWSCWSGWSPCTSGKKTRKRECNNPAPKDDGLPCIGNSDQTKNC
ncbi:putative complement component C8 alpha chain [Triplophysa rosa]|uniref:Complement component C8 alpha chain n=1 Tax=Triplophysa rosa TaxID=992332 RepID=A0A9W7WX60_TRIRA|nr:putative complement component C8 alpha chain [Triplophysa rosa]